MPQPISSTVAGVKSAMSFRTTDSRVRSPEACLQINRRTWARGRVASFAKLVHPGSRYRLGGYVPLAPQQRHRASHSRSNP